MALAPGASKVTPFKPILAEDVYKENAENRGVNGWKPQKHGSLDSPSGLQIQNYQNATHPNHTVIAIAGTNGLNDWDDNLSFITPRYYYSDDFGLVVALRRSLNALNRLLGSYWALS
jgi:hypothetical protein